jgi:hypothetical protein
MEKLFVNLAFKLLEIFPCYSETLSCDQHMSSMISRTIELLSLKLISTRHLQTSFRSLAMVLLFQVPLLLQMKTQSLKLQLATPKLALQQLAMELLPPHITQQQRVSVPPVDLPLRELPPLAQQQARRRMLVVQDLNLSLGRESWLAV